MMRIKKNDKVKVMSGKDKGKEGEVISLLPKKEKVKVKGVAIATRHLKARKQGDVSAVKKEETFIYLSKVMPICPSCKKACRIGKKSLDNGSYARMCMRCKEVM